MSSQGKIETENKQSVDNCMFAMNFQSVSLLHDMKRRQLKHLNFKQFCCGSCGNYFKHKDNVVRHVKRCSVKLGYMSSSGEIETENKHWRIQSSMTFIAEGDGAWREG